MIRDFLVQLRQHVERAYDYNARFHPAKPEYSPPADLYSSGSPSLSKKYGVSLSPSFCFSDTCTPENIGEATRLFECLLAERRWEELQHLKALEALFEEALFCAAQEGRVVAEIDCAAVLQGEEQRSADPT